MKLDCVFYYVSDLDRAVAFYAGTLGLQLTSRDAVARFHVDGLLFELVPTGERSRLCGAGNARVTFEVPEIHAAVAALESSGVRVGLVEHVSNGSLAVFADPDGNELVLWQYSPEWLASQGQAERGVSPGDAPAPPSMRGGRPRPEIRFESELPDSTEYLALFETTGWNASYGATSEELDRANRRSWYVVSAYDGDRLVAFGRVVTDGVLHAMIYDMIVRPEYQGQGLGSRVLSLLVARCKEAGIRDVQLFCALGKAPFYLRHGFVPRPVDAPGMQLRREG